MNTPPKKLVESAPEGTVWFGGPVERTKVCLRIFGDTLDPVAVTEILGHEPTESRRKGETWTGVRTGRIYEAKTGSWRFRAPDSDDADLDGQIMWLLSKLTGCLSVWRDLTEIYKIDLFCGLFLEARNRGISVSPETMKNLGERRISIGFDIYFDNIDGSEQHPSTEPPPSVRSG